MPLYLGDIIGGAGEADTLATFEALQDFGRINRSQADSRRWTVFLLEGLGGPVFLVVNFIDGVSVNDGRVLHGRVLQVDTTEVPVAGGRTLDERFPVAMAWLKQFLRQYGGGEDPVSPLLDYPAG